MPPHDPPIQEPLTRREIHGAGGRKLFTPRPEVTLLVRRTRDGVPGWYPIRFIVDTGADVTMIPAAFAQQYRLVGYDPAVVVTQTDTSFGGTLGGRWGQVQTQVGSRQLRIECFYFIDLTPKSNWFDRWWNKARRGRSTVEGPFVLGRAGVVTGGVGLLIERGAVHLSDQLFR